jgi:hypothetical protein
MKKGFRSSVVIFALLGYVMASCEKPTVFEDDVFINNLYEKATDTLLFEGSKYMVETYLYRNLMPGGPIPEKRPLISILFLVNIDSLDINDHLELEMLYVINGDLIYQAIPEYLEENNPPNYKQSFICREGPAWATEINVDVVLELSSKPDDARFFLIARDQVIEKVW